MVVTGWLVAAQESRDVSIIISLINDYILRPPARRWTLPCPPDTWKVEGINQSKTMNPLLSPFTLLAVREKTKGECSLDVKGREGTSSWPGHG